MMPYLPHQLLQRQKAAPHARLFRAHPHLEVAFQVARAIEGQTQKVDGFWAISAAFARVSLREPTKLDQLSLGRFQSKTELAQPKAQGTENAQSVRSILE